MSARRGSTETTVRIRCRRGTTTVHEWALFGPGLDPATCAPTVGRYEYDGTPEGLAEAMGPRVRERAEREGLVLVTRRVLVEPWR